MPGPNPLVFTSENNYYQIIGGAFGHRQGVGVAPGGGHGIDVVLGSAQFGICFAVTTIWCKNVLDGLRALLTKPDSHRAEALHARYRIIIGGGLSLDAAKQEIFALAGVSGTKIITSRPAWFCLSSMGAQAGVYLISNGAHVIGFKTGAGKLWFYDCDENGAGGLWELDSISDWQDKIYHFYDRGEVWSVWKITL